MQGFAVLDSVQSFLNWAKEGPEDACASPEDPYASPEDAHASPDPSRCWGKSPEKAGRNSVCSLILIYLMKLHLNFD